MKSFEQFLLEMPQYYPGQVVYMKPEKFVPISFRNISEFLLLGEDGTYGYFVNPGQTMGFVFELEVLHKKPSSVVPVMKLSLRDSVIGDLKQAHALRISEAYSKSNITSHWYNLYVKQFGGIVSDFEHLEGGHLLWKSFIRKAQGENRMVYLADGTTGEVFKEITPSVSESEIWSKDNSKKNLVLVYTEKR